jgi:hypothetical protein
MMRYTLLMLGLVVPLTAASAQANRRTQRTVTGNDRRAGDGAVHR